MDDDKDGMIESSESTDVSLLNLYSIYQLSSNKFIKEELESKTDAIRYKQFQNINLHITFDDLWAQWKNNPG